MKIAGNEVRVGNIISHQGKLWLAVKTQHVQPGKGGAYMQVELKSLIEGTKLNERFRSSESLERVYLEEKECSYLYKDGNAYVFMDQETFEQFNLSSDLLKEQEVFLQDGMIVKISFHEGVAVSLHLPDTVVLQIVDAEPVVRGQTAASSYKPAVLENGLRVMVPPHVESGTRIVITTVDQVYVERFKE